MCALKESIAFLGAGITVEVTCPGDDLHVLFYGGDRAHIGGMALAVPYVSHGKPSCALSSVAVPAHKDDLLCRIIARELSKAFACTVCACGGIHFDHISKQEIDDLCRNVCECAAGMANKLR